MRRQVLGGIAAGSLAAAVLALLGHVHLDAQATQPRTAVRRAPPAIRQRAARDGRVRVLVQFRSPSDRHIAEGFLPNAEARVAQRRALAATRGRVLGALPSAGRRLLRQFATVPYVALELTPSALTALEASNDVVRIMEDDILLADLAQTVPMVQGDQVWATGFDGTGTTVAILDTGVDASHAFFNGRVSLEACYSSTVPGTSESVCPDGQSVQVGGGLAAPCLLSECYHGTHVAGIAAGGGPLFGQRFSGVARNAQILAVQVFSDFMDSATCGGPPTCTRAYSSDVIAGLEFVYSIAVQQHVAAVNLSLGGGTFGAYCDDQPYKPAIDNLRSIGIPSIVAAGNSGQVAMLSSPACISSAISVGLVDKDDTISSFSNVASFLSLLAPGGGIASSVPGGAFETHGGTSMAAPHVTGTWALLRQAAATATVEAILNGLRQTGRPVMGPPLRRDGNRASHPRLPGPGLADRRQQAGTEADRRDAIADSRRSGSGHVHVERQRVRRVHDRSVAGLSPVHDDPECESATDDDCGCGHRLEFGAPQRQHAGTWRGNLDAPGGHDRFRRDAVHQCGRRRAGRHPDRHAGKRGERPERLAGPGADGCSEHQLCEMIYVGLLPPNRQWTVTMPTTPGTYEFRMFLDNGFLRAATSQPVAVGP